MRDFKIEDDDFQTVDLSDDVISRLRMSQEEFEEICRNRTRLEFKSMHVVTDGPPFHLHPHLVLDTFTAEGSHIQQTQLCRQCMDALRSNKLPHFQLRRGLTLAMF